MGWQDDARRTAISERIDLKTLPGRWVKVRLWTIGGKDEINTAMKKMQKGIDKKALVSLAMKKKGNKDLGEDEMLALLTEDEISAFMDGNLGEVASLMEIKIRCGLFEHNFDGITNAELSHDLLEFPEIAEEISALIEAFNRPLAQRTSNSSETQPSGSTTEASLSTETPSQTEVVQPS